VSSLDPRRVPLSWTATHHFDGVSRRDIVDEGVDGGVWVGACIYVCLVLRLIVLPTAACCHDLWCVMVSEYVAMDVCVRMRNVGRQLISELEAS